MNVCNFCSELRNQRNIVILFRMKYWEYYYKENEVLFYVLSCTVLLFSVKILAFAKCEPGQCSWYSGLAMGWITEELRLIPGKTKKFFSTQWCVQNSCGPHPSSPLDIEDLFPRVKVTRAWSYTSIPPHIFSACS